MHRETRTSQMTSLLPFTPTLFVGASNDGIRLVSSLSTFLAPSNDVIFIGKSVFCSSHCIPTFTGILFVFGMENAVYRSFVIHIEGQKASVHSILESTLPPLAFGHDVYHDKILSFNANLFAHDPIFILSGPTSMLFVHDMGGFLYVTKYQSAPLSLCLQSNQLAEPYDGFVITQGAWIHSLLIMVCGYSTQGSFVMSLCISYDINGSMILTFESTFFLDGLFSNEGISFVIPENFAFDPLSDTRCSINMLIGFRSPGGYLMQLSYHPHSLVWHCTHAPFMPQRKNVPVGISMGDSFSVAFCIYCGEDIWILPVSSISNYLLLREILSKAPQKVRYVFFTDLLSV